VIVNGRFVHSEPGGFRKYAVEVSSRLSDALLVCPPSPLARGARGKLWEQTALRVRARDRVLWSPTGSGPVRHPCHLVTIHDVAPFIDSNAVGRRFGVVQRWLLPNLARNATVVIVDSFAVGQELTEHLGTSPDRLLVAPPGVDDIFREVASMSRGEAREALGHKFRFDPGGPFVGGLVSSIPRKNSDAVVSALVTLAREQGVTALAAGWDGPSRVFGSARRPQSAMVTDLGALTPRELALFYRCLDVFVWLPNYEGFGLPVVECAAAGTPIVCTDVPAAIEHLSGDVAVVEGSTEAIRAVGNLLSDSDRTAAMGRRALASVAGLTWDNTARSIQRAAHLAEEAL